MDTRAAMTTIRAWYSIQDTVTSHAHQGATRLILQRGQEAVVTILGIGYDEVQVLKHFCIPMAAQTFDLLYTHLNVRLLARCPLDRNG
jgi:hypothetical protein